MEEIKLEDRVYQIEHQGETIHVSDWRYLKDTATAFEVMNFTADFIVKLNRYNLLEVIDGRESYSPPEVLAEVKRIAQRTDKYSRKKAIVGLNFSKKILLNAVNRILSKQIKGFDTMEEAFDWLVSNKH